MKTIKHNQPNGCERGAKLLVAGIFLGFGIATITPNISAADKPTIVVAKTEPASGLAYWQPAIGDGLAQMFITELTSLPNFKVLESVALDDLRKERALGESGEVSQAESVKKGQWKGADYTFKSTITRFGSKSSKYGGGGWLPRLPGVPSGAGNMSVSTSESEVQIDWRIIDNASREVITSGRGDGVEKVPGFNFSSYHGGGFSNNREFLDSALGKATMKAIAQIVEKVKALDVGPGARVQNAQQEKSDANKALRSVKGFVKAVDGKDVVVSLGSNNGFAKGDKVKIYRSIEKKNKKGEVIATTYEDVGEIKLVTVQKDKSMGQYTGSAKIDEGWVVADVAVNVDDL